MRGPLTFRNTAAHLGIELEDLKGLLAWCGIRTENNERMAELLFEYIDKRAAYMQSGDGGPHGGLYVCLWQPNHLNPILNDRGQILNDLVQCTFKINTVILRTEYLEGKRYACVGLEAKYSLYKPENMADFERVLQSIPFDHY